MGTPSAVAATTGRKLTLVGDMTREGGVAAIEAFAPEMILSVRFSYLFRRSTIAMATAGIINVHPGPLPGYRGLYAPFWQMTRGHDTMRCTVHLVDAGIDTGPVLSIEEVKLVPTRSMFWHATQLYLAGATRAVDYILGGLPVPQPQDPALAGSNKLPHRRGVRALHRTGLQPGPGRRLPGAAAPLHRPCGHPCRCAGPGIRRRMTAAPSTLGFTA